MGRAALSVEETEGEGIIDEWMRKEVGRGDDEEKVGIIVSERGSTSFSLYL